MANILDILTRAQALRQETALNSITPDRAGGIMYDTLILINQMQLEGGSLLISKVYSSVAAMEADTTPTSDLTGRALRPGQLAVIVPSSSSSSDMGSVYRYNEPGSWTLCGKIGGFPMDTVPTEGSSNGITSGAVYQLQQEVTTDISQLQQEVTADISQLELKVDELRGDVGEKESTTTRHDLTVTWNSATGVVADDTSADFGTTKGSSSWSASVYVDVSNYAGKVLHYLRRITASSNALTRSFGLVFFSAEGSSNAISGQTFKYGDASGSEMTEIEIPSNATLVRFTYNTADLEDFSAYVEETTPGQYTSGLGKDVQDLQAAVAGLPEKLTGATENDIATIASDGSFKDSGKAIESTLGLDAGGAMASNIPDNSAVIKSLADIDAKIGKYVFTPPTGNSYVTFPIKSGEKITFNVMIMGGSGSSLYARVGRNSTNQQFIIGLSATGSETITAERNFVYLYFYGIVADSGCKVEITRESSQQGEIMALDTRVTSLEAQVGTGGMFYTYKETASTNHNKSHFIVYCLVSGNIYVRYRIGLYNASVQGPTTPAKCYWRLEDTFFVTYDGESFTAITDAKLLTNGENEFVIRQTLPSKVDFTGGYHGDEYIFDENGDAISGAFAEFFADGALIDLSADIALTPCKSFFYKERSAMYETANSGDDQTNVGRLIAWHEKNTVFSPEGYKTTNRIDLVESIPFYAFGGISCIERYVSQYAMGEGDELTAMGTGTPSIDNQFSNYGNSKIFYKGNGYQVIAESHILFGDDDSANRVFVLNHEYYNKYYRQTQTLTSVSKLKSETTINVAKIS